jgi:hypothetical protein
MNYRPIWHGDGGRYVLLRCSLTLTGPCRDGRLTCAASGPFQLYIDGMRVTGGPGGAATESPLWYPRDLTGNWDVGPHELVVVIDGGPGQSKPWFAMHGELAAAASGTVAHTIESGLHWHALELRRPPEGCPPEELPDERYSALEDPRLTGTPWEGVITIDVRFAGTAPVTEERQVDAQEFAAFEETHADGGLTFLPVPALPRSGKFVHRDGLLTGPAPSASLQTGPERAFSFVLDFGRVVTGVPNLRLRDGRAGTVEIGLATTWGRIERRLRYVCGPGRQDWFALHHVRARYAVVHLSGFDEECQFERLAICERCVPVAGSSVLDLGETFAATWSHGAASLRDHRLDVYHTTRPPQACDWLGTTALLWNDAARTGYTDTARATLLGRAPEPTTTSASAFAVCLEAYHLWSGDDETVQSLLPAAVSSATTAADVGGTTQSLAEHAASTLAAANLCRSLGRTDDADRCDKRHVELARIIDSRWCEDPGLYLDGTVGNEISQFTQALVLAAGVVSPVRAARMAQAMRRPGIAPVEDLRQAFFLADGLWRGAQGVRALEVVKNQWLRIAGREGRTWHEKRATEAGRLAPGCDYLLVRWLMGISPLEAGFGRTRVRPDFALIAQGHGELATPRGALSVSWRTEDPNEEMRTTLTLQTEGDGSTELVMDRGDRRVVALSVNGEVVWRNEKMYPNPSVHEIAADEAAVTLVFDRPGTWKVSLE